jgi:uroporphyrinogen-III decarboxylase
MGNDMIYFSHVWHLGRKEKKDTQGRIHYIDGMMKTRDSITDLTFPDLDTIEKKLASTCDLLQNTGFGLICGAQTAGFTVPTAIGYQDFCLFTLTDSNFIDDFQQYVHEYSLKELEMYLQYPIDAVKIASGLITSSGSMISPDMLERFEFKFIKEQCDLIKSYGKKIIFHIDGKVKAWISRFLNLGMDILNPIDPSANGQDIYKLKEEFGSQLTLCGNINVDGVLLKGTPEEVKSDVYKHIEKLAVGGGYIVASSHDLHQLIPVENIYAMRDAVHEYNFKCSRNLTVNT